MRTHLCIILFILRYSWIVTASPEAHVRDALFSAPAGESSSIPGQIAGNDPLAADGREAVTVDPRSPREGNSLYVQTPSPGAPVDSDGDRSRVDSEGDSARGPHETLLSVFKEALLGYYIKQSIHRPVCVLFRTSGPVSRLEKQAHVVWAKAQKESESQLESWRLGTFFNQSKPTKGFRVPDQLPMLRCYIGTARPADYIYKATRKAKDLLGWLSRQVTRHNDRIPEYSARALSTITEDIQLVFIVFVDKGSHFEVESQMNQLRDGYQGIIRVFAVHPNSPDASRFMTEYRVKTLPAVVAVDIQGVAKPTAARRFEGPSLALAEVQGYLRLRMSPVAALTLRDVERLVLPRRPGSGEPASTLVSFHAPWGRDTTSYLDGLRRSAEEFRLADGTGLAFGALDLTKYPEVVTRWVDATYAKRVPFSVLFWSTAEDGTKEGPVPHQKLFPDVVPTPWNVAEFLEASEVSLRDADGVEMEYSPWAGAFAGSEGSYGISHYSPHTCNAAANASLWTASVDNDLTDLKQGQSHKRSKVKKKRSTEDTAGITSSWITKRPVRNPPQMRIGRIPQVTDGSWSSVVERSPAAPSPLGRRPAAREGGTSAVLVAFVQTDCSSCRRKLPVFERLLEPLKSIEGASMYIMNCTSDRKTCTQLNVIGFPTLIAFRGYGRVGGERCLMQGQDAQLLRMDFHGMMEEKAILEWFSEISLPAVKKLSSAKQFAQSYQKDDVVLMATTYPLSLAGRYLPKLAGHRGWYPLECYRVACEQLYGRARCLAAVSENLGRRDAERNSKGEDMVVTQVEMYRRDGIKSTIFSLGRSLLVTLQDEADSQIHAFHSPHRYKLKEGQTCEDDHSSCTELLVAFVQDHGRLPVTHLTMTGFHTHSGTKFGEHHENSVFEHELPVMIALANRGSLVEGSPFLQAFTSAAYEFYNQMVFVTLDADEFPKWAAQFVPRGYRQQILEYSDRITEDFIPSLNVFPRLCIVRQDDHQHAAMFPTAGPFTLAPAAGPRVVTGMEVLRFARQFLQRGQEMMVRTEQF